ncbi:hypothetical protein [Paenibacillus crassostreae]|uniref:Uncharacterized protein n=1 Tax=Paenibacillus crassostreae TaxID=1763538 RepID=A0A167DI60_9BACL|nr:hypothetical protein [Paenibacillus crassostreae]AOZ91439.1 hypothetical protein LPB68_03940 [Paenibacillus crassostreae]OAB74402.1 hypothetical protein PNBC_10020 [Paenibacillus crassostreae]
MKGGLSVGLSSKKTQRKKRVQIANNGQSVNGATPKLTPQQISVVAGILAGYFSIDSVIYTRDNVLQVLLTTNKLTELPILGPPEQTEIQDTINIIASNMR